MTSPAMTASSRKRLRIVPGQCAWASQIGPFHEIELASGWRRALLLDQRHLGADGLVAAGLLTAMGSYVVERMLSELYPDQVPSLVQLSCQALNPAKNGQWLYGEACILAVRGDLLLAAAELFTDKESVACLNWTGRLCSS